MYQFLPSSLQLSPTFYCPPKIILIMIIHTYIALWHCSKHFTSLQSFNSHKPHHSSWGE